MRFQPHHEGLSVNMNDDNPRADAPRRFAPKIVGGIDHSEKSEDKKQAFAYALERHGIGKRDDDTRLLSGEEFVELVRQLSPAQQWEIHDELLKRAKERASESAPSLSTIARNKRLREARRDAWWDAEAATRYYRAALEFRLAVSVARCRGIPEGNFGGPFRPANGSPESGESARLGMVANWREALVKQLLTPAPDMAAVSWKRAALAAGKWRHTGTTREQIEQAIAEDVAFLAAHPTKRRVGK
jgi:hypothetical protein